jgi:hypothetical protein
MSEPWYKTYPRLISKNDLCDVPLKVLADCPPEPTTKAGLFQLRVFRTDTDATTNTYDVLVTRRDLQKIIDAMIENKPFLFVKKSGDWAEVIVGEFQK